MVKNRLGLLCQIGMLIRVYLTITYECELDHKQYALMQHLMAECLRRIKGFAILKIT